MALFQNECEEIPRWNSDRVHDEARALIERSGCDYMEELMTAVFIAHTKILTAVRLSKKKQELSITVPKLDHFVHRIFREAARAFWKAPFLFQDTGSFVERQKNILQIEGLATEAITTAVRSLLPVKDILNRYLEADTEEVDDETEAVSVNPVVTAPAVAPVSSAPSASAPASVPVPTPEKSEVSAPDAATTTTTITKEVATVEAPAPSVVQIDTEPAVHFSDYDAVFQEGKVGPEMEYNPKDDDIIEEGRIDINESSAKPLADDDVEDLEANAETKTVAKPVTKPVSDKIETEEVEVLE